MSCVWGSSGEEAFGSGVGAMGVQLAPEPSSRSYRRGGGVGNWGGDIGMGGGEREVDGGKVGVGDGVYEVAKL